MDRRSFLLTAAGAGAALGEQPAVATTAAVASAAMRHAVHLALEPGERPSGSRRLRSAKDRADVMGCNLNWKAGTIVQA